MNPTTLAPASNPSPLTRWLGWFGLGLATLALSTPLVAAKPTSEAEAAQLRIVQAMSEQLRARIDELPVLIPAGQPVGEAKEQTVTLNRKAVIVDGQRFDGVVITTPEPKASFAWAFVYPPQVSRWYILRERGDMQGFRDFLRRPGAKLPGSEGLTTDGAATVTLQKLDSSLLSPNSRYILWFSFKDDAPAEITVRAGFFAKPALTNNALPALLFPAPPPKG